MLLPDLRVKALSVLNMSYASCPSVAQQKRFDLNYLGCSTEHSLSDERLYVDDYSTLELIIWAALPGSAPRGMCQCGVQSAASLYRRQPCPQKLPHQGLHPRAASVGCHRASALPAGPSQRSGAVTFMCYTAGLQSEIVLLEMSWVGSIRCMYTCMSADDSSVPRDT